MGTVPSMAVFAEENPASVEATDGLVTNSPTQVLSQSSANIYDVTYSLPAGVSFESPDGESVQSGESYRFYLRTDELFDTSQMQVTVNDSVLTPDNTGLYFIEQVTGPVHIQVSNVSLKQAVVTWKADCEGCRIDVMTTLENNMMPFGETLDFQVRVFDGYLADGLTVQVNGFVIKEDKQDDSVFFYSIPDVSESQEIIVSGVEPKPTENEENQDNNSSNEEPSANNSQETQAQNQTTAATESQPTSTTTVNTSGNTSVSNNSGNSVGNNGSSSVSSNNGASSSSGNNGASSVSSASNTDSPQDEDTKTGDGNNLFYLLSFLSLLSGTGFLLYWKFRKQ